MGRNICNHLKWSMWKIFFFEAYLFHTWAMCIALLPPKSWPVQCMPRLKGKST